MILKSCFILVLSVAWAVSGASFSNVFVQTGPEVAPAVELVQYDTPSYAFEYGSPQKAQLNAAPLGFEYPFAQSYGYAPCTSGVCLYPGQSIASAGSVLPSANIAYTAPNYNALNPGYEYSYVIVNPNAGDQKSDGGVIRGEYSYLQPGGFVRELQYVADDTQGVNAIVKNFLPVEEVKYTEIVHHTPPCPEVKSEALTEAQNEDHEARHGGHEDSKALENPEAHEKPASNEEKPKENDDQGAVVIEHHEGDVEAHGKSPEGSAEQIKELPEDQLKSHHEGLEEIIVVPENHESHDHTHEKIVEGSQARVPQENHQAAGHEHGVVENNVYVSYNDIIKCIQAAMAKVNIQPSRPISPLTYLVYNKPC